MDVHLLAQSGGVQAGIVLGFCLLFVVFAAIVVVAKLMVVGNPSEMLIISGKRQRDGAGYRTLIGGRTLVIPIIEKVARISLRNMQVQLEVKAQAGGGTMVPIQQRTQDRDWLLARPFSTTATSERSNSSKKPPGPN